MGKVLFMRKGETHTAPLSGILASDLAVGSSVYLMENGSAVEYLVVNQGIPSGSSLYDASCDGLWLLRRELVTNDRWDSSDNDYANSKANSYLNGSMLNRFDTKTKEIIKQVKIPYVKGTGSGGSVASGTNGLSTKVFLLSGYECGGNTSTSSVLPVDGACLEYFQYTVGYETHYLRIAYSAGVAKEWFLRSPTTNGTTTVWVAITSGALAGVNVTYSDWIRPALILPHNAVFDKNTLLLKGVS